MKSLRRHYLFILHYLSFSFLFAIRCTGRSLSLASNAVNFDTEPLDFDELVSIHLAEIKIGFPDALVITLIGRTTAVGVWIPEIIGG